MIVWCLRATNITAIGAHLRLTQCKDWCCWILRNLIEWIRLKFKWHTGKTTVNSVGNMLRYFESCSEYFDAVCDVILTLAPWDMCLRNAWVCAINGGKSKRAVRVEYIETSTFSLQFIWLLNEASYRLLIKQFWNLMVPKLIQPELVTKNKNSPTVCL